MSDMPRTSGGFRGCGLTDSNRFVAGLGLTLCIVLNHSHYDDYDTPGLRSSILQANP